MLNNFEDRLASGSISPKSQPVVDSVSVQPVAEETPEVVAKIEPVVEKKENQSGSHDQWRSATEKARCIILMLILESFEPKTEPKFVIPRLPKFKKKKFV